jgi:hypothetical protein
VVGVIALPYRGGILPSSKGKAEAALRLLQAVGVLTLVPSATMFFLLVLRGSDSPLVYVIAASMYVGLGLTLYASVILWTDD